jgi:negative regulator of sigma E activity
MRNSSERQIGSILAVMTAPDAEQRLQQAALAAHDAEARGDFSAANEAWRRYRLIGDALRDPDELLAEGVAISETARALAG